MMRALVDAVFAETDAYRLWIGTFPDNLRARRAYEAVGFEAEGVARGSAFFQGEHRDELILSILRPQWANGGFAACEFASRPLATHRYGQTGIGITDMRLGGRLAAAIEVLEDIDRRHRPAADALKDWGLSHRFAGAGDRAAIGNIVYDGLRRKRSAGWLLDADTARAVGFGALLLEWGETPQSLNASARRRPLRAAAADRRRAALGRRTAIQPSRLTRSPPTARIGRRRFLRRRSAATGSPRRKRSPRGRRSTCAPTR